MHQLDFRTNEAREHVDRHVQGCQAFCQRVPEQPVEQRRPAQPGNIQAEYPFQVVSMDLVIPLPASARGNTTSLLFQDAFSGFVMSTSMFSTTAHDVAQAYEECVSGGSGPAL